MDFGRRDSFYGAISLPCNNPLYSGPWISGSLWSLVSRMPMGSVTIPFTRGHGFREMKKYFVIDNVPEGNNPLYSGPWISGNDYQVFVVDTEGGNNPLYSGPWISGTGHCAYQANCLLYT